MPRYGILCATRDYMVTMFGRYQQPSPRCDADIGPLLDAVGLEAGPPQFECRPEVSGDY